MYFLFQILSGTGKIILITENLVEDKADNPSNLVNQAGGLAVQPILYPADLSVPLDLYTPVAEMSNLHCMVVNDSKFRDIQAVESLVNLTNFIQDAGPSAFVEVSRVA